MAVLRPKVIAASDAAIGADGLGALDARLPHVGFDLGGLHDGAVAGLGFDALDDVNHAVEGGLGEIGEKTGLAEHGFFDERVAGADGDAVAAGNAA